MIRNVPIKKKAESFGPRCPGSRCFRPRIPGTVSTKFNRRSDSKLFPPEIGAVYFFSEKKKKEIHNFVNLFMAFDEF